MTKRRNISLCVAVVSVVAAAFAAFSFLLIEWPEEMSEAYDGGVILRDSAGDVMRVSLGKGDVDCRPFYKADECDWIVKALVAAEDGEFWSHCGIRPLSILRAAFQNVFYRRRISGASTISMQTVRLIKPHPKTMWWKWREAVAAVKMECARDKKWILSQYLNRAPFGSNFIGIEAAAHGWFGKGVKELGIGESAMLAGMVQAPSRFRPDRRYDRAILRRNYVLGRMEKMGYITREQRIAANSVRPLIRRLPRPFRNPHYCDYFLRSLGKDRAAQQLCADITTPLNADIQKIVAAAVDSAAVEGGYSAAAVVVKVSTGKVVALHCSGEYFDGGDGQVNTALAARPAGSTLKPFLAALAMDIGLATPETRLMDTPMAVKGYRPANFDSAYRGRVTLADSLILSLNIPFVRMIRSVGVERFGDKLRELGFRQLNNSDAEAGLGMAIGNVEVSLVELVSAYATIARGGDGIFSKESCWLVSDILSGSERSAAALGHVADVVSSRFAWKTGTSSAYRDAWTVAWNPEYVVGIWCGHKKGGFGDKSLVGAKAAAPVCWRIARLMYPQNNGPWFQNPVGIVGRDICALTGMAASPDCTEVEKGRVIAGRSSPELCGVHRRDANGKLVTVEKNVGESSFRIVTPENGAAFELVDGILSQSIVFRVAGNDERSRLWWFVNGEAYGETAGREPFVMKAACGEYCVSAVNAEGETSLVEFKINNASRQVCGNDFKKGK